MNKKTQILYLVLFFFLITANCRREEKVAPALPSPESINIDFSFFSTPLNETSNYGLAYRSVLPWKILFEDSLQIYHYLYDKLSENDFSYQDENTWLISKIVWYGNEKYDMNYFETVEEDSVTTKLFASLYIDSDTIYTDLLLFDGYFYPDSANIWQLNKPDTSNTFLKYLNFNENIKSDNSKELKVTNLLIDENNGNYIFYKDSIDGLFDTYFDIFEKANENHTIFQYNRTNAVGRIKDIYYFGDENWHCWNENKEDTECVSEKGVGSVINRKY